MILSLLKVLNASHLPQTDLHMSLIISGLQITQNTGVVDASHLKTPYNVIVILKLWKLLKLHSQ